MLFLHFILLSLMFEIPINLQLERNINYPPIAYFRFSNIVLRNQKKKRKKCDNVGRTLVISHFQKTNFEK